MHNISILIKNYFRCFIGGLNGKKNKGRYISGALLCLMISAIMVGAFTVTAIGTTTQFVNISKDLPGAEEMAMFSGITMGLLLMCLLTVIRSVYPNKNTDTELLLALPLTKFQIIFSKVFYSYIFDMLSFAAVMAPTFIVYYVLVPAVSPWMLIWGISFILLLPLLTNSLSYLIGFLFIKISSKFKYYSIIQSILTLLLLAGYMVIQYSLPGYLSTFDGDPQEYINDILIIKVLLNWILHNNIVYFLIVIAICVIPYFLTIMLRANSFGKDFGKYRSKNKTLTFEINKPLKSLYYKELKYYFNTSIYFVNTIIGSFFLIGLSVAYRVIGSNKIFEVISSVFPEGFHLNPNILLTMVASVIISMTVTTGVSISLEGKNLWILKVHPVSEITIFIAKILVNLTITGVSIIISVPLLINYQQWYYGIFFFILPFLSSAISTLFGLLINLMYPKMEWDSEEVVVKRSMSSGLSMFMGVFLVIIPFVVYYFLGRNTWDFLTYCGVTIVIDILILGVLWGIIKTMGVKQFQKIK